MGDAERETVDEIRTVLKLALKHSEPHIIYSYAVSMSLLSKDVATGTPERTDCDDALAQVHQHFDNEISKLEELIDQHLADLQARANKGILTAS